MKKKELLRRIEELESRLITEERTRRVEDKNIELRMNIIEERLNAISRIHSNHTAEEFKRNKETNRKIDKLKEAMEALLFRELTRTIDNITNLIGKDTEEQENCKKCVEKPAKKCKKCEKTEKTAAKAEEKAEIKAGDMVKVLKSKDDYIQEIHDMIGKVCKVKGDWQGEIFDVWQPDKKDYWEFSRDEIEPVEKKRGRGRPVGSKNKYNNRKGVKEL